MFYVCYLLLYFKAIELQNYNSIYQLGSEVNITCFSFFPIALLRWQYNNGTEIINTSKGHGLQLYITRISGILNGTSFICQASIMLSSGATVSDKKMITLVVSG